jgi:hypothetical protein
MVTTRSAAAAGRRRLMARFETALARATWVSGPPDLPTVKNLSIATFPRYKDADKLRSSCEYMNDISRF